jgi:CoA:oxalate CoA-transferase
MANEPFDAEDVPVGRRQSLLDGVVVLDLTRFLAGPFAGMILADLGATVLKVEQITGDTTRNQPPYFLDEDSAYFLAINRNKKSVSLDIKSEAGRRILRQLIAGADVILDNLRAPQRVELGLDFESLRDINPKIISCSVTGFGSDGPYADRPAYDIVVEALAGVMSLTGPAGGPSVRAGVPIGDLTAGLYAVIGALAGLAKRDRTGTGEHIDIGMLDSQISLLTYLAQYYFTGGLVAQHQGRAHVSIPTYNTFATLDGTELVVAANTQEMWRSLCLAFDRTDLADDDRFTTGARRLANRDALLTELNAEFAKRSSDDVLQMLIEREVPVARINSIAEALVDPQVRARDMVVSVRHRNGSSMPTLGTPVKADNSEGDEFFSPPGLGEQTREVLVELGIADAEIAALLDEGVIRMPADTAREDPLGAGLTK